MRKTLGISVVLILVFSLPLFAGGKQEAPVTADVVEITFLHVFTGARAELVDEVVRNFNNSQDKIIVKHQHAPGWYGGLLEQLQMLAVARQLPEVAIMGLSESVTMRRDLGAVSLQPYINRDSYELSGFYSQFLSLGQDSATREQYALPYAISTPLIFVNKDLLRRAGLDPNREPETWEELRAWAKKINDLGADISGIGFQFQFDTWQFQVLLESFGGRMADINTRKVLFNEEPGKRVMQYVLSMMHDDKSFPNVSGSQAADNFVNGKVGIMVASTGNLGSFTANAKFDLGVLVLPKWDDLQRKNPRRVAAGGSNIYILPSTQEKQDAAWEFIKFMLSEESSKKILDMGYMVARKGLSAPGNRAYEMIDDIVNWYNWPDSGARITDLVLNSIISAFNKEQTGVQALDNAAEQTKRILGW